MLYYVVLNEKQLDDKECWFGENLGSSSNGQF